MLPHWHLIAQLTPALTEEAYARLIPEMVRHNYFQVGAFVEERCIALSGYWIGHKLYCGKYLEMTTSWWMKRTVPRASEVS